MTPVLLTLATVWAVCSIVLMGVMLLARRSAALRRHLFGAAPAGNVRQLRSPKAERPATRLAA